MRGSGASGAGAAVRVLPLLPLMPVLSAASWPGFGSAVVTTALPVSPYPPARIPYACEDAFQASLSCSGTLTRTQ
ncbi:hypothetical protein GCM10010207_39290 [Streptomyces atratus]|nr:hypothetical protein GCM10010207_39290 [Streptomyces atratus]